MNGAMCEYRDDAGRVMIDFVWRLARLTSVSGVSSTYKRLDTYLLYLKRTLEGMEKAQHEYSVEAFTEDYWNAVQECTDKYIEDFRNDVQVALLTQEEARVWMSRIGQALTPGNQH